MSGPQRCIKQGPGKTPPAQPPEVRTLPPTHAAAWQPTPEFVDVVARFNAGEYRGCVEPLETLFFADRNTFHQGLLQYVVALHQLRMGLVRSPRRLLRQVLELLSPYPEWQEGVDLTALREHAAAQLAALPQGVVEATPDVAGGWWIAPPRW